jgi:hypothetical protein
VALTKEERNLQARINRKLRREGQQLFKSRAGLEQDMRGEWHIKDSNKRVVAWGIDWWRFEELAAEVGVSPMKPDVTDLPNSGDTLSPTSGPTENQVAS